MPRCVIARRRAGGRSESIAQRESPPGGGQARERLRANAGSSERSMSLPGGANRSRCRSKPESATAFHGGTEGLKEGDRVVTGAVGANERTAIRRRRIRFGGGDGGSNAEESPRENDNVASSLNWMTCTKLIAPAKWKCTRCAEFR